MEANASITQLHHINILTANLPAMRAFYAQVLGLKDGWRPPFDVGGSWLYQDDVPIVHLVDRPETQGMPSGRMEHFALSGTNIKHFTRILGEKDIDFHVIPIPKTRLQSVNLQDPDGNHIEVLFESSE